MLRYQSKIVRRILQPKVFCSTAAANENERTSVSLIQKLSAEFEDISPIIRDLKNKELSNIHFDEWKSRIHLMKKYHFNDTECFKMISKYPCLLKIPLEKFNKSADQWFASNLRMAKVNLVLFNHPYLFEVDVMDLKERLPVLRTYCKSGDALAELLIKSANVMYDDWEMTLKKIDYLMTERRFKIGEITMCGALSKSLTFIKFRFDLLEKCGIYKQDTTPVHKINKYDKSRYVNPSLKSILELNMDHFVEISKISPEEYSVSKELFMNQEFDDTDDFEEYNSYE